MGPGLQITILMIIIASFLLQSAECNVFQVRCSKQTFDPNIDSKFDKCINDIKKVLKGDNTPPQYEPDVCRGKVIFRYSCIPNCDQDCCTACRNQVGSAMDTVCVHSVGAYFNNLNCEARYEIYHWSPPN
ncbi:hypothetical protein LINGRAHAP2_LOCUS1728 [Linum grandiflorum]